MKNTLTKVNCLLLPFFLPLTIFSQGSKINQKPNFLVIMVDDLGFGDLSINGALDVKTPNIDRLFHQGMIFTNSYSNSTVCSPTRASLLTGRYPDMVGVPGVIRTNEDNNWGYLKEDIHTLPQVLKCVGYKTAIIGKWHLGLDSPNLPNERGFDYFKGFLGDMMQDYWTHLNNGNNFMRFNYEEINPQGHATELFSDWTIDYLNSANLHNSPFFLYLAYNAPHYPIQPPNDWLLKVKSRNPELSEKRALNVAFVEHLDYEIGRVLSALEKAGMKENTLIVFTSDNGGSLPHGASNGALRGGKQDMYEGGIKVPTCFVWPNKISQESKSDNLMLTMDIFPTLCEIAGMKIDFEIDGESLMSVIKYNKQNSGNRATFFMRREGGKYGGLCYYAARKGAFKLVQNTPWEALQLFNMENDPLEQNSLNESHPEFVELKNLLSQHIRKTGKIPWQKPLQNSK